MIRWPWRRDAEQDRTNECCVVGTRLLQSYFDGETDPATTRRVWIHVEECLRCGEDLSAYGKIKDALMRRERRDEAAVERLRDFADSLLHGGKDAAAEDAVPETGS
jgi:anti-sigma factor RsiW